MENKILVDARGLSCPGPITQLVKAYRKAKNNDIIEIWATDPGFKQDVKSWVEKTRNELLELKEDEDKIIAIIKVVNR